MIANFASGSAAYKLHEFICLDTWIVPADGNRYVMARHDIDVLGAARTSGEPVPAVVNAAWGIETAAKPNGDYFPVPDEWQWWFFNFWDWASGYCLPIGEHIGTHVNPNNPRVVYDDYTPGSLLALYAGMIKDAKSHTDAASPETGARDVVTRRNMGASRAWSWLCRPCTGAVMRVVEQVGARLKIEAVDFASRPREYHNLPRHLYYYGSQVDAHGNVTRYPDVKEAFRVWGLSPAGTAMPLVAPGGSFWLDRAATLALSPGDKVNAYYQA